MKKTLAEIEKAAILTALFNNDLNRTHTAHDLGIGLRTLQRKLKAYGIGAYVSANHGADLTALAAAIEACNA